MKNRKYSLCLVIIIAIMIMMVATLSSSNSEKLKVEILEGNNKNLGDVSLIYTPGNSVFNNTQIELNKNGINTKSKLGKYVARDFINIDEKYDSFVKWDDNASIYQNENCIGKIEFFTDFADESQSYIQIYEKNKDTNKTKIFKIPLDNKIFNKSYVNIVFNEMIEDDIYILTNQANYQGYQQKLYIIKINLKTQVSEIITELQFQEDNIETYLNDMVFSNDNKIYIEFYRVGLEREYTDFIVYDIEKNTVIKTNEFMNKIGNQGRLLSQNRFDYEVVDDKLNLLIGDSKGNISKLIYEINSEGLKLHKTIEYNLNLNYRQYDINRGQAKVKLIDDKIYSLVTSKANLRGTLPNSTNMELNSMKPTDFTIYDINKNDIIYKAELSSGDAYMYNKLYFIKNK